MMFGNGPRVTGAQNRGIIELSLKRTAMKAMTQIIHYIHGVKQAYIIVCVA
jgi:hypothetical protein